MIQKIKPNFTKYIKKIYEQKFYQKKYVKSWKGEYQQNVQSMNQIIIKYKSKN